RVALYRPLCKEEAAKNALIARLLKSGTREYPTPLALNRALDELYGATLSTGIVKRGETTAVTFGINCIKDEFTGETGVLQAATRLLCQVISDPVTEQSGFSKEFFERERENLKMKIQNRINDKKTYAAERCYEEMCKEEPFGVYEYGQVEDLEQLNPQALFAQYQDLLTSPMDVFVCGDIDWEEMMPMFAHFKPQGALPQTSLITEVGSVKHITEELDVNQGKLSMGFRTGIGADDPLFPALYLYNSILGSGVHSKLFRNVREKLSLCYYAYSRLERFKGTMMISSGIEFDKFQDAYDEILLQTEEMKQETISDEELSSALSSLTNQLKAMADTPAALLDYAMIQAMMKEITEPNEMIEILKTVTKEQIKEVAQRVTLDTVYFLKNKGGNQE
ncbi:MAG: insulinase family protein, partial [Ruminococcaceae bacterium]|nr:insulinase family protein [Oscillospiraceae bacterium]